MKLNRVLRLGFFLSVLVLLAPAGFVFGADGGDDSAPYYDPYDNNPPGPPPNYNLVDSSYFQGVPNLPEPLTNDAGGYYIFEDTVAGRWYITNFLYSRGNSLEQFHGSILVTLESPPQPNVNIWGRGFELSADLKQNDRWGWVKWPDSIAPDLYEIWWDITIDYAKKKDTGDFRDTLGVEVAGCAIDFNIWTSGHKSPFSAAQIYLGDDMTPLSDVPGFTDTYSGITDQYQMGDPEKDPNTSRFTLKMLPGATYNKNGMIGSGTVYSDRYGGSWAYEGNGVQFATLFCPAAFPPAFVVCEDEDEDDDDDEDDEEDDGDKDGDDDEDEENCDRSYAICFGGSVLDTIKATDPNPSDLLTMSILSGAGSLTSTPSISPVFGYYELFPDTSGEYIVAFLVTDTAGNTDTMEVTYTVQVSTAPVVTIGDSTIFSCGPLEICLPVDIIDNDCDVTSVTTSFGDYTGTLSGFDQLGRINQLGGSITQIGGGAPGTILYTASDFVPPVNSQSGVAVTLPNFVFAYDVDDYGTFPNGIEPGNSADHLLGAPTDLTFTSPGAGGPDGGDGDGSVAFGQGDHCIVKFDEEITTCHGSNTDFVLFTNTNGGGTGTLTFSLHGDSVYSVTRTVPGGSASSGVGGITFDLPDGIVFNELEIECTSGNLEIDAFAARTAPSSTTADICFYADTAGVYEINVTAEDACGNIGSGTAYVTVDLNEAPAADAGDDFSLFMCDWEEVCLDVSFADPDDNIILTELLSGPGSMTGDQICFTPTMAGAFTFVIHAEDDCGLHAYDTVVVSISDNDPPIATTPQDVSMSMCEPSELCHDFAVMDPNGGPLTWTKLAGVGAITTDGHFCFTPTVSGTYSAAVIVTDSCGVSDTASIFYDLIINTAPAATDPSSPVALFQCEAEQVCYQFEAGDAENGTLTWSLLTGVGTLTTGGSYCFTPSGAGSYVVTVAVTDSCGLADTTGLTYEIELNEAPSIAFGADTTLELCAPQEICASYVATDPEGAPGLLETLVSGYGVIDTVANQVCFTPTVDGCYDFVVQVTDACGVSELDTVTVCVSFGEFAQIECPTEPINVSLCQPDQICQALNISSPSATVYASHGIFTDGEICFDADTSGTYLITVIVAEECGSDTCLLTFNVDIGQAAQIDCPDPITEFICAPGEVCVPVGVYGSGATVLVSPIGAYNAGSLCFAADTSGHYEILVVATTDCGIDSCLVVADVSINAPPVATDPAPIDTFMCEAAEICYQFDAGDPDGPVTFARLSGEGTVTTDGLWCFTGSHGTHTVEVVVSDLCGAADTTTMTYNVTINSAPVVDLGDDETKFICASGIVCQYYSVADADDNLSSIELIWGAATLDTAQKKLCFDPPVAGVYEFVLKAIDLCGAVYFDTLQVTIEINEAPIVDAGTDLTIFECSLQEICWSADASDPDGNLTSVELIEGPGVFDGSSICFTPTGTYNYEFVLKATDFCGAESFDTVAVYFTLNSPPTADAGGDQTLFLCAPTEICWPVSCSDVDGNLSGCALVSGPGSYGDAMICFAPSATGVYEFVIEASDACGSTHRDTVLIDVTINSAPVCSVPNDTLIFQCDATQICLPAFGADADGNLAFCQIVSGPGTLIDGDWCYMPASDQTVTVTLHCEDSCGAVCESQFTVQIDINGPPEIALGNDTSIFLCAGSEICLPYMSTDPDDPRPTSVTLLSGPGALDEANSQICFTPTESGSNTFVVRIDDECGEFDEDTIIVDVGFNSAPLAFAGDDQTLFLCDADETVCWPASCSDPDGNLTDCVFSGPGLYDGASICFDPTASGVYTFTLSALNDCGEAHSDTVTIDVTINSAPTIVAANDTALFLCAPEEFCFGYTVSDPDGSDGLVVSMVSGYGTLDAAANQVCFTPTTDGCYEFVLSVTDSCGAVSMDTVEVCVTFGEVATIIDCPDGPIDVFLCQLGTVCRALTVSPATADVWVSFGTYADGVLCFPADSAGVYNITAIASEACGADTCLLTFNVEVGETVNIDCPVPSARFLCGPGDVCVDVGIYGAGAQVEVSPIGTFGSGQVCFPADTAGHYEIQIVATTECGIDSCTVIVDVTLNSSPYVEELAPVDAFICEPGSICCPFAAHDDDGDALTWSRLSGDGTVSADGEWCFDVPVSGTYTVCAVVSDSCGAADTLCHTYNITINTAPIIVFDSKASTSVFLCGGGTVCKTYTVIDPDDNGVVEQLLSPFGTIDTLGNEICFVADTSGDYIIIVGATDGCGASGADTLTITVQINSPPVANAGSDQTIFQCNPTEICWPASCADPDDNLDSCYLTEGDGIFAAGQICFTPDGSGDYTFVLRSVDDCGEFDEDTVTINVTTNNAPVCDVADDTTYFQCSPTQVSRRVTATDIDGNFDHCEIITGPGSIIDSFWVYTPTADQSVTVQVMCLDECGAYCEASFTVDFNVNSPPVVDAGEDQEWFLCDPETRCFPIVASDEDGNLSTVELVDGPAGANYNAGAEEICFAVPPGEGVHTFVIKATDACDATSFDTTNITVQYNSPPTMDLINNPTVYMEGPGEVCFPVDINDVDGNLDGVSTTLGVYNSGVGRVCFDADTSGVYCMIITATDDCPESVTDTVCVTVVIDECIHVQIEKTHAAIQGQTETVRIFLNGTGKELGGYDILVAYDQSALTVQSVEPGLLHNDCGWEYFNYRHGDNGNCGNGCPSGMLRIIAFAETNNGANHPGCFLDGMIGSIADINFMVSDDRTLECQFAPVSFFWTDCGDNGFSGRVGDTLWISRNVFSFENQNIADLDHGFPGYFGTPDLCLIGGDPDKPTPLRCVDFTNGGVDIVCADSIDARADINLNGVSYEIADAVVLSNYFVYGLSVFNISVEGQIAASDVNADGITLSVADLVYLIRVIVGDTPPMPKVAPNNQMPQAQLVVRNGVLTVIEADYRIGAISVILEGEVEPQLHENALSMEMRYNYDGEQTRVLVYNMDGRAFLESGPVLRLGDEVKVVSVDVGAYDGFTLAGKVKELPENFHLAQNYPNPFNPSTTFEFALPVAAEWRLVVYNVLGQSVRTWRGDSEAGFVRVDWDASTYASGVYFYRLQADDFTATKKMVLLK